MRAYKRRDQYLYDHNMDLIHMELSWVWWHRTRMNSKMKTYRSRNSLSANIPHYLASFGNFLAWDTADVVVVTFVDRSHIYHQPTILVTIRTKKQEIMV
jgi:hypothetical protein